MKRRDFLKLSAAPAFIPLFDLFPEDVARALQAGEDVQYEGKNLRMTYCLAGPVKVWGILVFEVDPGECNRRIEASRRGRHRAMSIRIAFEWWEQYVRREGDVVMG